MEDSMLGLGTRSWRRWAAAIAVMLAWMMPAVAQTDYSGIYYIASAGKGAANSNNYTYSANNPDNNFYLCPTEGWCFYKPVDDFAPHTSTDYPNPFLTTYKCKTNDYHNGNSSAAIWTIEKAPNSNHYYIKQTLTGKYLLSNGQIRTSDNPDRIRVHLQEVDVDTLSDPNIALFDIYPISGANLVIKPVGITDGNHSAHTGHSDHKWLTVNYGNYNYLTGQSGKTGGPSGYANTAGIIGIYTEDDANGKFRLEKATIDPPTITNNFNGTITITSAVEGAIIYYTTNGETPTTTSYTGMGDTPVTFDLEEGVTVIKAVAKGSSDYFPSSVCTYQIPQCEAPVFSVNLGIATLTCFTPGASIYYAFGDSQDEPSTLYTGPFTIENLITRAIAKSTGYLPSTVAYYYNYAPVVVHSSDEITNMNGSYILADDFSSTGSVGTVDNPFKGSINGNYNPFALNGHALIGVAENATIKNIVVSSVSYNGSGGDVGAIVNTAKGSTKIYNCGVRAGSVSGGSNTGGLVGRIETGSSVRVVNCYNFANVSGGDYAAGIVGKNDGTVSDGGTVGNVRIALCMMYGNVTGATHISPVYGGNHKDNVGKFTEYNYWRYCSGLQYTDLNDQLPVQEDEYLIRFPFFRHILNTHREMAAFFLFGGVLSNDMADITESGIAEIGHWALKKDVAAYPIIEPWPSNTHSTPTSVPDITGDYAGKLLTEMGNRGYLDVTVYIGESEYSVSLPITDMDTLNYDFTWGKVVLPFANEFEENTDYTRICTGWKITSIAGGTAGTFENYNVSDRYCTAKDLYDNTLFVFAQGGNYIVPYGVTGIEITANFAKAYYLCDDHYEIAYTGTPTGNDNAGYTGRTGLAGNTPNQFHDQTVYHTLNAALTVMVTSGSVHDQAVVLIGNYHWDGEDIPEGDMRKKGYTIMSIDADNNQEPDYALYSNHTANRPHVPPTRYDFLAMIPLGMSSYLHGRVFYPNVPIWKPHGWFEITETCTTRADQFEIESYNFDTSDDTRNYRCIINGGYFTQMVRSFGNHCRKLKYYQIGGRAYVKEFYPGNHSIRSYANTLVPVNVTGGEIEQCFMTGYGKGTAYGENIYFWCAGGRIHKFLGAYMESPIQSVNHNANNPGTVSLTAEIDHARIYRFFGGGTTSKARITGDIKVTIDNSLVDFYCGGPEFGDMVTGANGKTVKTTARHTTFREYYGAGFGGTAITYTNDADSTMVFNRQGANSIIANGFSYPTFYFSRFYLNPSNTIGRLCYKEDYGIGNCYKYEYIMHSRGHASVARFYTGYAMFSLAKSGSVTNTLTDCTVEGSFYGGGCQGTVDGTVTSTLTDCTILHSAFGGGYKAESNQVEVYKAEGQADPLSVYHGEDGVFSPFGPIPTPDIYTWVQGDGTHSNEADENAQRLYTGTDVTLTDLGNVTGAITLTLDGHTVVTENVFGGGNESKSLNNATVTIQGTSEVNGNVFGGGNEAIVNQNTIVNLKQGATVSGNVYGGGNKGEVGGNSEVIIQDTQNP